MRFKTLVSPLAIAFGLGLSGAAFAQNSIAGMDLTDDQVPEVQAHCEELNTQADNENVSEVAPDADTADAPADDAGAADDAAADDADAGDAAASDAAAGAELDLSQVTLADCVEAGFIVQ